MQNLLKMELLDFDEKTDSREPLYSKSVIGTLIGLTAIGFLSKILSLPLLGLELLFGAPALLAGYIIGRQILRKYAKPVGVLHFALPLLVHGYAWFEIFGSSSNINWMYAIGLPLGVIGLPILVQVAKIK